MFTDPKGLFPAPWCTKLEIFLGQCPDIGGDIKPEDVPEEWIKDWLEDVCSKPCSKIYDSCVRAIAISCYGAGTLCLAPCLILKEKCEEKRKKVCDPKPCKKQI